LAKLVIQKIYRYILYINSEKFIKYYISSIFSGQAGTGLHASKPRGAGPLTHNIMFHNN
jgi:hypothetical protein